MGTAREIALIAALLPGCYQPRASTGAPCETRAECPSGQDCVNGRCERDGTVAEPDADVSGEDAAMVDAPPDARAIDAAIPPDASLVWGTPTLIPGITGANESDPAMTANRLHFAYIVSQAGNDEIYVASRADTASAFVPVLFPFNSTGHDRSPELSPDGNTMYFTQLMDVYVSTKVGGAWQTPTVVMGLSSSMTYENDVGVSPDGLTAIVARGGSGAKQLWIATRASTALPFGTPVVATALNITADVAAPSLTDGAAVVYFHTGATRDLYVAYKSGTSFTAPQPITELNTAGRDAAPSVNAANNRLLLDRNGDLYETSR